MKSVKEFLVGTILVPVFTRVGSIAAGWLMSELATAPETAVQIEIGITALGAILIDLITRKAIR